MIAIQKKIVIDEHGVPQEVIIPWAQFCELSEALGLDSTPPRRLSCAKRSTTPAPGGARRSLRWMSGEGHRPPPPREALLPNGCLVIARRGCGPLCKPVAALSDPASSPNVRPMSGDWAGCLRLRVGTERAILRVVPPELPEAPEGTLDVLLIGPRGDVYK